MATQPRSQQKRPPSHQFILGFLDGCQHFLLFPAPFLSGRQHRRSPACYIHLVREEKEEDFLSLYLGNRGEEEEGTQFWPPLTCRRQEGGGFSSSSFPFLHFSSILTTEETTRGCVLWHRFFLLPFDLPCQRRKGCRCRRHINSPFKTKKYCINL